MSDHLMHTIKGGRKKEKRKLESLNGENPNGHHKAILSREISVLLVESHMSNIRWWWVEKWESENLHKALLAERRSSILRHEHNQGLSFQMNVCNRFWDLDSSDGSGIQSKIHVMIHWNQHIPPDKSPYSFPQKGHLFLKHSSFSLSIIHLFCA